MAYHVTEEELYNDAMRWFKGGATHIRFRRDCDYEEHIGKIINVCKTCIRVKNGRSGELRIAHRFVTDFEWWS